MCADILLLWGLEIVSRKCPVYYLPPTSCYPVQKVCWYRPGRWHGRRPMPECQSAAPETIYFVIAKWPTGTSLVV